MTNREQPCFQEILRTKKIEDQIQIQDVLYNPSSLSLSFFMKSENMITPQQRTDIESHIKNTLPFLECVELFFAHQKSIEEEEPAFGLYFPCVLWHTQKMCPGLNGLIKEMTYTYENEKLIFHLPSDFAVNKLKQKNWEREIGHKIKAEIGLSKEICLLCDQEEQQAHSEAFEEEKKEKIKAVLAQKSMENPTSFQSQPSKMRSKKKSAGNRVIYKKNISRPVVPIKGNIEEETVVCFEGTIFEKTHKETRSGKIILNFALTDGTYSVMCKMFLTAKEFEAIGDDIQENGCYKVDGLLRYDTYSKDITLSVYNINVGTPKPLREDVASEKRIELNMHTNMSEMDGICPASKLIEQAAAWGHKAVAITDYGSVQAFPEAMIAGDKFDVKIIYGMEAYVFHDNSQIIEKTNAEPLTQTVVVFDIETTGLSYKHDQITEIGAVKVEKGAVTETFKALVNPSIPIPAKIVELTGITDDMVADKPTIEEVLPKFLKFINRAPVVAHNAEFDVSFIKVQAHRQGHVFDPVVIDTLLLSRLLLKKRKRHRLNQVAKHFKISLENHHRAVDDALATAKIYIKFLDILKTQGINNMAGINALGAQDLDYKNVRPYHSMVLVKNQDGLKDLYKLVSHANTKTFHKTPRIAKSLLAQNREHLLIGSGGESGELFQTILANTSEEEIESIADFYDYLEIQPVENNLFLMEKGIVKSREELENINRQILQLGKKLKKPVVATGNTHFLNPEDEIYRRIIRNGKGFSGAGDRRPLYFRTTDEMLEAFSHLGKESAYEVVINAPKQIEQGIDAILPIPKETFAPRIEGADEQLEAMCYKKAKSIYGDNLPELVAERLEKELNSIIKNGYAVMYIIAQKLVTKSLEDGYLVGSRGSVGSSFAATMSDITEVNPLPPHYICPQCKKTEFITDGSIGSGFDLPDKQCPHCDIPYKKDGHDIPFATFLGFDGDKEPDIDLNFAGVYQATSHKYTETLFGEGYVYKAGTISTVADKTAFGLVKKYFEEQMEEEISLLEVGRLAKACTGIKRTSGQHPGGIMVIPSYKDVHDFTPIQYPANDVNAGVLTTHFDYHSLSGRILKLDILGHDVPTIIRDLEDLTGVDVKTVPLDDRKTVKIFTSVEPLNIIDEDYRLDIGSLGVPEFGTQFVRQMLADTKPETFAELVRISGLSHGEQVWLDNAQDLVRNKTIEIKDVISTRDDIMVYLMYQGLPPLKAFKIMEKVRKGKGLTEEDVSLMKENGVPEWYIWSCNQIKYMFPKAHAVAYVTMSFRIAYFKVHYPLAFYATYFGTKVDDFDAQLICQGKHAVVSKMKALNASKEALSKKEQDLYGVLELAVEMYARGFGFLKVDLQTSEAGKFKIIGDKILPPFQSLQGVGGAAASSLAKVKTQGEILSIEDLQTKSKISKTVVEALREHGCLEGLSESNQLSLFGF